VFTEKPNSGYLFFVFFFKKYEAHNTAPYISHLHRSLILFLYFVLFLLFLCHQTHPHQFIFTLKNAGTILDII